MTSANGSGDYLQGYVFFEVFHLITSCYDQEKRTAFRQCEFDDAHSIGYGCVNFLPQSEQANGFSPV